MNDATAQQTPAVTLEAIIETGRKVAYQVRDNLDVLFADVHDAAGRVQAARAALDRRIREHEFHVERLRKAQAALADKSLSEQLSAGPYDEAYATVARKVKGLAELRATGATDEQIIARFTETFHGLRQMMKYQPVRIEVRGGTPDQLGIWVDANYEEKDPQLNAAQIVACARRIDRIPKPTESTDDEPRSSGGKKKRPPRKRNRSKAKPTLPSAATVPPPPRPDVKPTRRKRDRRKIKLPHAAREHMEELAKARGKKPGTMDDALRAALHRISGGEEQWNALRTKGADDAALKDAIGKAFGIAGGYSGPDFEYSVKGGRDPRFWNTGTERGKPALSGKALVAEVRRLLQISHPGEVAFNEAKRAQQDARTLALPVIDDGAETEVVIVPGSTVPYMLKELSIDLKALESRMRHRRGPLLPPRGDTSLPHGHIGMPLILRDGDDSPWAVVTCAHKGVGTHDRRLYTLQPLLTATEYRDQTKFSPHDWEDAKMVNPNKEPEDVPLYGVKVTAPDGTQWVMGDDADRITAEWEGTREEGRAVDQLFEASKPANTDATGATEATNAPPDEELSLFSHWWQMLTRELEQDGFETSEPTRVKRAARAHFDQHRTIAEAAARIMKDFPSDKPADRPVARKRNRKPAAKPQPTSAAPPTGRDWAAFWKSMEAMLTSRGIVLSPAVEKAARRLFDEGKDFGDARAQLTEAFEVKPKPNGKAAPNDPATIGASGAFAAHA